jgi:GNAT superfamily N-acetyltransferase
MARALTILPPAPLTREHDIGGFDCGAPMLNDWLTKRAPANQVSGASRCYVVATTANAVIGYHALASGAVVVADASGRLRRNMPDPVPVVILGRLAVDRNAQGQGFGRSLFADAARRVAAAADLIGIRGLLVHALDDQARRFYLALGFDASPLDPMTLMVTLSDIHAAIDGLTGEGRSSNR